MQMYVLLGQMLGSSSSSSMPCDYSSNFLNQMQLSKYAKLPSTSPFIRLDRWKGCINSTSFQHSSIRTISATNLGSLIFSGSVGSSLPFCKRALVDHLCHISLTTVYTAPELTTLKPPNTFLVNPLVASTSALDLSGS